MARTSVLRNVFDERVWETIRSRSRIHNGDRVVVLGGYIREARRMGWTWGLCGHAAQVSESTARYYVAQYRKKYAA